MDASDGPGDAARLLLDAARRLDPVDAALARETHLEALAAAVWAGDLGRPGGVREAAEAARAAPPGPDPPSALAWLSERTRVTPTEWALGIEARVRALLSAGEAAETLYRESIAHLSRSRAQVELARGHLLYGEWLRRERRRMDAREQLRTAHTMLDAMGIGGSRTGPAASWPLPARPPASAPCKPAMNSRPSRPRSRCWPATACRTPRSGRGYSSARARSSTT